MAPPLAGLTVIEIAGIGPGPFAAMMLADHGAEVTRIERPGDRPLFDPALDMTLRRRAATEAVDLKTPDGRSRVIALAAGADVLIEGFRPGTMERLGLGPGDLAGVAPALVYARMTGWGQTGPLARTAGHDINYLALAGALSVIGEADRPTPPPVNALADFGGGGMMLAFGVLAAVIAARREGRGRVVDCAMLDGTGLLLSSVWTLTAMGLWRGRAANLLDGGAPFYRCYRCACGGQVAVGAIEGPFYAALLEGLGLAGAGLPEQWDRSAWPEITERFAARFAEKARDAWAAAFAETDACVTPVLSLAEAATHAQARARSAHLEAGGHPLPAPAPRMAPLRGAGDS